MGPSSPYPFAAGIGRLPASPTNPGPKKMILKHDKFGSFFRLKDGVLECQPQMADPKTNFPRSDEWGEVDWDRGVEPKDVNEMRKIQSDLEATR